MKICIFSDIHGNGPAFWRAYKMMIKEKADIYVFLGDLCGYYFDQIPIFDALNTLPNLVCVKGNHDESFLKIREGDLQLASIYKERYGSSIEHLMCQETTELVQWLSRLPDSLFIKEFNILICHGSPSNFIDGYIYPDSNLDDFVGYSADFFFLGHTHYPMCRKIGEKVVLNPGSLGQPRNGDWPTYATIELPEKRVAFEKISYCKTDLLDQIERIGEENSYIKDVIKR
jgi:putative phosphoesterase